MNPASANVARQRAHWDRVLGADNIGAAAEPLAGRRLAREIAFAQTPEFLLLHRVLAEHSDPLILDVGGGLGIHAIALAREGHRVVVADLSGERLRTLGRTLSALGLSRRVLLVQCAAENLALRTGVFDVAWTHSVLIHTLDTAADEVARCLRATGDAVLCEPTVANPLVNLYRRWFAPGAWPAITRYYTPQRTAQTLGALHAGGCRHFHILGFLAFIWQFAVPSPLLFRLTLWPLHWLDQGLGRIWPAYRRRAWFVVMAGKGRGAEAAPEREVEPWP